MAEVSELIYETCKTYMITQGKFLLILEGFTAVIMIGYFYFVQGLSVYDVAVIIAFSLVGIAGSFGVAWFGIRINTFANSRTAFASLQGKPFPVYAIPMKSGISIGMLLISTELLIMLCIMPVSYTHLDVYKRQHPTLTMAGVMNLTLMSSSLRLSCTLEPPVGCKYS